ncbi:MAG: hypothetical protein AB1407_09845 [Spirochaetota bacterium]
MEKEKAKKEEKKTEDLEPCTSPHNAESSRPMENEDACDDGVK